MFCNPLGGNIQKIFYINQKIMRQVRLKRGILELKIHQISKPNTFGLAYTS